jgi:hypothetical protein
VPCVVEAFQTGPRKVIHRTDSLCSCWNEQHNMLKWQPSFLFTCTTNSTFRHELFAIQEVCDHLGYYAAYSCNSLQTFRDSLSDPSSKAQLSNILGLLDPYELEITHCSQYTLSWSLGHHLHTWCCQTQVPRLFSAVHNSNKTILQKFRKQLFLSRRPTCIFSSFYVLMFSWPCIIV